VLRFAKPEHRLPNTQRCQGWVGLGWEHVCGPLGAATSAEYTVGAQ
jgi:hypothetical protein